MKPSEMTEEQARALAAVMFNMIGGSEILFFDLEAYFMSQGCEFVRETKKMFTEFMATAKVLHKQYNRLTKLAVSSAECEKMSPKDGYEYDCNTAARTALQIYDATHKQDEDALIKIESSLKLIARHPMFGSEVYGRYMPDIASE